MKRVIIAILAIVAVNSFAGKIPEAKSLHPDLYTIQITFARFPTDDIEMDDEEHKRIDEEYDILLEELVETDDYEDLESDERATARSLLYSRVRRKALLNHIESSKEVEYKDLATIYTRSGEPFPEAYSHVVKGLFDAESTTLILSEFNLALSEMETENMKSSKKHTYTDICINEWHESIARVGGGNNNGFLLIKCYPPTNVPSSQTFE